MTPFDKMARYYLEYLWLKVSIDTLILPGLIDFSSKVNPLSYAFLVFVNYNMIEL